MCEVIKIVIFHEKEVIFVSIYITLTFCCPKFELQNWYEAIQLRLFIVMYL